MSGDPTQNLKITSKIDDDYGRKVWQVKEEKHEMIQISEKKKEELKYLESRKEDLDLSKFMNVTKIINKEDES